jgi:hypothetical protein
MRLVAGVRVNFPFDDIVRGKFRQAFSRARWIASQKWWEIPEADYDRVVKFFAESGYVVINGSEVVAQPTAPGS